MSDSDSDDLMFNATLMVFKMIFILINIMNTKKLRWLRVVSFRGCLLAWFFQYQCRFRPTQTMLAWSRKFDQCFDGYRCFRLMTRHSSCHWFWIDSEYSSYDWTYCSINCLTYASLDYFTECRLAAIVPQNRQRLQWKDICCNWNSKYCPAQYICQRKHSGGPDPPHICHRCYSVSNMPRPCPF